MAFQETASSGLDDTIQQFIAFAVANAGFTAGSSVAVATGLSLGRTMYQCSKSGFTWYFARVGTNQATPAPSEGFFSIMSTDSGKTDIEPDPASTPSSATLTSTWGFEGPYSNVFMYTDGTSVHCVIELASSIYTHFAIGSITKSEVFTGGEFVAGMQQRTKQNTPSVWRDMASNYASALTPGVRLNTPPNGGYSSAANFFSHIRSEQTGRTGHDRFARFSGPTGSGLTANNASGEVYNGMYTHALQGQIQSTGEDFLRDTGANDQNQRTPLLPNIIRLRDNVSNLWRISGHIPVMRSCWMDYLDPASIILNDWQVFPLTQKYGDNVQCPSSFGLGIAYKRA
jgi:hypothetical protein